MQISLSALSIPIRLLERLLDEIRKYQKRKEIKKQLFRALCTEIETYEAQFSELTNIGEERLLPLLQSLAYKPPTLKINQIIRCIADMQTQYSGIIHSFIKLAEGCKQVSSYEGFMKHLIDTDYRLHDLVNVIAESVINGSVKIDSRFYRFFKMHGDAIIEKAEIGDVDELVNEAKFYIDIVKKRIKPYALKRLITRKTRIYYTKSSEKLAKAFQKIKIEKTRMIDLKYYVPRKFLPIVLLLEESLPLE